MSHPIFHTVYDIDVLTGKHSTPRPLEGITMNGRIAVLYSSEGLNDTAHTEDCCCCGGNEITNDLQVNVNILAYAILYEKGDMIQFAPTMASKSVEMNHVPFYASVFV